MDAPFERLAVSRDPRPCRVTAPPGQCISRPIQLRKMLHGMNAHVNPTLWVCSIVKSGVWGIEPVTLHLSRTASILCESQTRTFASAPVYLAIETLHAALHAALQSRLASLGRLLRLNVCLGRLASILVYSAFESLSRSAPV